MSSMVKTLPFWGAAHVCSNFHGAWFQYYDHYLPTVEHAMMLEKAWLFRDDDVAQKILANANSPLFNPIVAKGLGRRVSGYDEITWVKHRYDIVYKAKLLQALQNPYIAHYYLEHEGYRFVEASPNDLVWGVGLLSDDPDINDPTKWKGLNLLGDICTSIAAMGEDLLKMSALAVMGELTTGGLASTLYQRKAREIVNDWGVNLTTQHPVIQSNRLTHPWQVVRFNGRSFLYPIIERGKTAHYATAVYESNPITPVGRFRIPYAVT